VRKDRGRREAKRDGFQIRMRSPVAHPIRLAPGISNFIFAGKSKSPKTLYFLSDLRILKKSKIALVS
jgi:hypothetical protein